DQIQLGSTNHPALEFQVVADEMSTGVLEIERQISFNTIAPPASSTVTAATAATAGPKVGMELLGQALRAMVEGRGLEDVLGIVLDPAIQPSGAARGFVLLARPGGELEVRMARGRRGQALAGRDFQLSQSVPKRVFETSRVVYENDVPPGRDTQINLKIKS